MCTALQKYLNFAKGINTPPEPTVCTVNGHFHLAMCLDYI